MLDIKDLRRQTAASQQQEFEEAAHQHFERALVGLRQGRKQTRVMRMRLDPIFCSEKQLEVTLAGVAHRVFEMCAQLEPELLSWTNWVGSREEGSRESGFDIVFSWPKADRQQELINNTEANGEIARKISMAMKDGLASVQQRVARIQSDALEKCSKRAKACHSSASIMDLEPYLDFAYPKESPEHVEMELTPECLGPVAATIFAAYAEGKPILQSRGNLGRYSWHDLIVHW